MSKKLKTIYVDDDPTCIRLFTDVVTSCQDIDLKSTFNSTENAYDYIFNNEIDLAFLDVEMPGNNGMWLAEKIQGKKIDIIFISSHTKYAVDAFEACALDYIVKPIDEEKLEKVMARYTRKKEREQDNDHQFAQIEEFYTNYLNEKKKPKRIFINLIGQTIIVKLEDILYLEANESYTVIHQVNGTKHTSSKKLKMYSEAFAQDKDFVRIHRSYIVNRNYVSSILKEGRKHKFAVQMTNGDELEMSFLKKDEIIRDLTVDF